MNQLVRKNTDCNPIQIVSFGYHWLVIVDGFGLFIVPFHQGKSRVVGY